MEADTGVTIFLLWPKEFLKGVTNWKNRPCWQIIFSILRHAANEIFLKKSGKSWQLLSFCYCHINETPLSKMGSNFGIKELGVQI